MRQNEMVLNYEQAQKLFWALERACNYHMGTNFYPIVWKRLADYLQDCQTNPYRKHQSVTIRARSNMSAAALRTMYR